MMVLLADDSRPARNIIKNLLTEMGIGNICNFLEAEKGEGALEILNEHYIDLAFLDWNMSTRMTGLDVLKALRQIDKCKQTSVIMVTSESEKINVIESLKCGANDYIVKPIDVKTFKEKVHKVLKLPY